MKIENMFQFVLLACSLCRVISSLSLAFLMGLSLNSSFRITFLLL